EQLGIHAGAARRPGTEVIAKEPRGGGERKFTPVPRSGAGARAQRASAEPPGIAPRFARASKGCRDVERWCRSRADGELRQGWWRPTSPARGVLITRLTAALRG